MRAGELGCHPPWVLRTVKREVDFQREITLTPFPDLSLAGEAGVAALAAALATVTRVVDRAPAVAQGRARDRAGRRATPRRSPAGSTARAA